MKYPHGIEYRYRQDLLRLSRTLKLTLKKHMSPFVPRMVAEAGDIHKLPHGVIVRQDAWADDLRIALNRVARDMVDPTTQAAKDAVKYGPLTNQYNKKEWIKLIRSQYGVDPTKEDPERFDDLMKKWARDNASLINDIPKKTINQIADATTEALMSGKDPEDMTRDIFDIMAERTEVTDARAKLIARDQIAKLNGRFTQERQTDIGVDSYVWRTVGDERVRETHADVDGETFSWDNPPDETDGNHPGEDYQCRCWAEPVLPEEVDFQASLLDDGEEVDAELEDA
jgi:SPP1 gp7 family putative phage head morphogenesis protein